ncbi:hypothetical protein BD626DRAFT_478781, partial [Schizophyllum amplum]
MRWGMGGPATLRLLARADHDRVPARTLRLTASSPQSHAVKLSGDPSLPTMLSSVNIPQGSV